MRVLFFTFLFKLNQLQEKSIIGSDVSPGLHQSQSLIQVYLLISDEIGQHHGGGPARSLPAVHHHMAATLQSCIHPGGGRVEVVRDVDPRQVDYLERE